MNGSMCQKINCSFYDVPEFQPNPDISGIGVLIGFGASAYLTLVFCTAYFLLDREGNTNAVDQLVIETLPALLGWKKKRTSDKWSEALQNAVLTFSDLQIVTGISLAVSGYSQVHCQLTAYDAELIIDLVWFSSITHLATLTSLRRYFRERPALKIWRMVCTGITVGMLSYALISTGYDVELPPASDLPSTWLLAWPAWCFLHPHELDNAVKAYSQAGQTGYVTYNSPYIALIMTFLVVSFVTRTIRLFPTASDKIRTVFRTKPSQALKNKLARLKHRVRCAKTNSDRRFRRLSYKSLLSIYCLVESTFDVYTSSSWEITWLAVALGWGTIRVLQDRSVGTFGGLEQQNAWGFGQVVALFLLILPLFAFVEMVYETITGAAAERSQDLGSSGNPTYGPVQSYRDFYQKQWYRKLVLLIYLLSLAVAGDLLVTFAWYGWIELLRFKPLLSFLASFYAIWFALNLAIVWSYIIVCLSLGDLVPSLKRPRTVSFAFHQFRYTMSKAQLRCLQSIFWYGIILVLVGISIAFDIHFKMYVFGQNGDKGNGDNGK